MPNQLKRSLPSDAPASSAGRADQNEQAGRKRRRTSKNDVSINDTNKTLRHVFGRKTYAWENQAANSAAASRGNNWAQLMDVDMPDAQAEDGDAGVEELEAVLAEEQAQEAQAKLGNTVAGADEEMGSGGLETAPIEEDVQLAQMSAALDEELAADAQTAPQENTTGSSVEAPKNASKDGLDLALEEYLAAESLAQQQARDSNIDGLGADPQAQAQVDNAQFETEDADPSKSNADCEDEFEYLFDSGSGDGQEHDDNATGDDSATIGDDDLESLFASNSGDELNDETPGELGIEATGENSATNASDELDSLFDFKPGDEFDDETTGEHVIETPVQGIFVKDDAALEALLASILDNQSDDEDDDVIFVSSTPLGFWESPFTKRSSRKSIPSPENIIDLCSDDPAEIPTEKAIDEAVDKAIEKVEPKQAKPKRKAPTKRPARVVEDTIDDEAHDKELGSTLSAAMDFIMY